MGYLMPVSQRVRDYWLLEWTTLSYRELRSYLAHLTISTQFQAYISFKGSRCLTANTTSTFLTLNFCNNANNFSPTPSNPVSSLYPYKNFCLPPKFSVINTSASVCSNLKEQMYLLYLRKLWLLRRQRTILSIWSLEPMAEQRARTMPQEVWRILPQMIDLTRLF